MRPTNGGVGFRLVKDAIPASAAASELDAVWLIAGGEGCESTSSLFEGVPVCDSQPLTFREGSRGEVSSASSSPSVAASALAEWLRGGSWGGEGLRGEEGKPRPRPERDGLRDAIE